MTPPRGYPEIPKSEFYGSTWDERNAFLSAAADCPDIRLADELCTTVYNLVLNAPSEYRTDPDSPSVVAYCIERDSAMRRWAEKFYLAEVEWVIPTAWQAISVWQIRRDQGKSNPFAFFHLYAKVPNFGWPPWFGLNVSEEEYRRQAETEFRRTLEKYIAANKEARAKEPGIEMREGKNPVAIRYTWAALRICLRWSYADIAELYSGSEGVSEQAIRRMVSRICKRIVLPNPNLRVPRKRP